MSFQRASQRFHGFLTLIQHGLKPAQRLLNLTLRNTQRVVFHFQCALLALLRMETFCQSAKFRLSTSKLFVP